MNIRLPFTTLTASAQIELYRGDLLEGKLDRARDD